MGNIRLCRDEDVTVILAIINAAAEAYRGVIPSDQWHEPYMSLTQLRRDIDAGIAFWGLEAEGDLVGVMGLQPVRDVDLIRHAYVLPGRQRQGVGAALIEYLRRQSSRRMLVGTWADAKWAIDFYRHHGFELVSGKRRTEFLKGYWSIPDRQVETSVVLEAQPLSNPSLQ